MEAGAHVWISDAEGDDAWLLAEVLKRTEEELKLQEVDKPGNVFTRPRLTQSTSSDDAPVELKYEGVELANTPLSDADREEGRDDDLITLPHLHEPAILHAVSDRFYHGKIYTWTGPVLIAVNPFQRLPLYTNEILEAYRREGLLRSQNLGGGKEKLGPHIYSIADSSYRQMMSEKRKSQSILISGESGAGKTESTKIVMLYLTTLGSGRSSSSAPKEPAPKEGGKPSFEDLSVMERVLQSNPILEAFGNARTLRNDNSSRFGKFIELGFSRAGTLLGAKVQTYLLEKIRLAFHASGERNYHIFYQLLRGASEEQLHKYCFHEGVTGGLELTNYFHYTGQGGAPQLREFTDESGLKYTLKSMRSMGWNEEKIDRVLSITAGLLHLGQVSFDSVESEGGQEIAAISDPKIVKDAANLLGVDEQKLVTALTERLMLTRGETITIQLSPAAAVDSRDALSKTVYGAMFLWVVAQVNECIGWENDSDVRSSCGVLDIFGFECFAINSFEQLCINFTNEALQQQFNKFIFKMEQTEYESEKIDWAFIAFPDNQDCLDTIQSKPNGILSVLDDECRLGSRGTDRGFVNKLYKTYIPERKQTESENGRFLATAIQQAKGIFCVRHFAGVVQYTSSTGFLEKNKDEIPLTAKNLFETAHSEILKDMYDIQMKDTEERAAKPSQAAGGRAKPAKAKSVGQQFKEQLDNLMEKVESTEPHYIRCLKPNDAAKPKMLTRKRLTEQLRYGGVLEAVRVARMGYPVRLDHEGFFKRYRMLLPSTDDDVLPWSMEGEEAQKLCVRLVDLLLKEGAEVVEKQRSGIKPNLDEMSWSEKIRNTQRQPAPMEFPKSDVQLGLSKVFMRKPPHDALEAHRVFHQHASAVMVQTWWRYLQESRRYLILCESALTVQRFYRGCVGRARWWRLREAVAGQLLTNVFRMLINRRKHDRKKRGTIRFQALYRGHMARRILATIKIQTFARMVKRRWMYRRLKSATIALQCAQRFRVAKAVLGDFKKDQKDIGKLKASNEELKMEMASLKAMLAAQAQGAASSAQHESELKEKQNQINALEKRIAELESQLKAQKVLVEKLEKQLEDQQNLSAKEIEALRQHNKMLASAPPPSPKRRHTQRPQVQEQSLPAAPISIQPVVFEGATVSPEVLAEHRAHVAKLEEELDAERAARRDADGEIIRLRAAMSGVEMSTEELEALTSQDESGEIPAQAQPKKMPSVSSSASLSEVDQEEINEAKEKERLQEQLVQEHMNKLREEAKANKGNLPSPREMAPEVTGTEEQNIMSPVRNISSELESEKKAVTPEARASPRMAGFLGMRNEPSVDAASQVHSLMRSPSEYFPMIRRGGPNAGEELNDDEQSVMAVGWKVEVTNRKEREEALRYVELSMSFRGCLNEYPEACVFSHPTILFK
mmetsp:Transcript_39271/g.59237  ORF Transcript_39271/g.59237 Transcript_39271/m.59237 type:complete len:1407 (+) Transcript_39271:381-4601(+)